MPSVDQLEKNGWRKVGRNIVESNSYEIAVVVLTFIALFMAVVSQQIYNCSKYELIACHQRTSSLLTS